MVHYLFGRTPLLCSLVLVILCLIGSSSSVKQDISYVCERTRNPPFCLALLKNKPGIDLVGFCLYTIELAKINATNTLTLIQSLIKNTTDPALKKRYASCSELYNMSLGALDNAKRAVISGNYKGTYSGGMNVLEEVNRCDSEPPSDPSSLPRDNKDLEDMAIIIMEIGKMWPEETSFIQINA